MVWDTLQNRRRGSRLSVLHKIDHQLVDVKKENYLKSGDSRTRGVLLVLQSEKTICMNMNYNYLTTIYRSILIQIYYVFLVLFRIFHLDLEKFLSKNCKYIFFYQKFVHLGENTSKYCRQIIVVHVHATVSFSKVHQACHNIANGIKQGSDSKKD